MRRFGVSRSALYAWRDTPGGPSAAEWDEAHLVNTIIDIRAADDSYGSARITAEPLRRCRIRSAGLSTPTGLIARGPATSPASPATEGGCIWRPCA